MTTRSSSRHRVRGPGSSGLAFLVIALATVVPWSGSNLGPSAATAPAALAASNEGNERTGVELGPTDPGTVIEFSLSLHQPGAEALQRFLAGLQDPASADYHRYIDAATYGRRFGLPDVDVAALEGWLRTTGLTPVRTFVQRTQMIVSGPARTVESAFKVGLVDARDAPLSRTYHRPVGRPVVPAPIAALVDGVADLSDRPPRTDRTGAKAVTGGALRPTDLAAAYDIGPMYTAHLQGDGVTVAIVSFCSHLADDIAVYEGHYDIEDPPNGNAVTQVAVGKGKVEDCKDPATGKIDRAEPSGDIEVVRAIAPHANILNFEASSTASHAAVLSAIADDGRATIVTDSYGGCYDPGSPDEALGLKALDTLYGHGVSVFVASGDQGAYDCYGQDNTNHALSVDWPSATAYAISVGGTALNVRTDGAYYDEAVWQDYLSIAGSGGGLNPVEKMPLWQKGPGVLNSFSNGKRQSPDVAASADGMASPYNLYYTLDGATSATPHGVGGTSMSSPLWAALTALIKQHVDATPGLTWPGMAGIQEMLYDIAATPSNGAFHDIVKGNNLYYQATPGWDFATGLGSPDVAKLDAAIIAYLRH